MAYEYVFDSSGRRVSSWNAGAGAVVEETAYWGGMPLTFDAGGALHFEQEDWLGTVRLTSSYAGATESTQGSQPYGDSLAVSGTDADTYHFALLDHDAESGTDHAQFRQYADSAGRWMSPDPYDGSYDWGNPQSYNRYSYVMGNPLGLVDPSGQDGDGSIFGTIVSNVTVTATDPLADLLDLTLQALPVAGEIADIGLGVFDLGKLLGFWDVPQFHGSLQPRPSSPAPCGSSSGTLMDSGNAISGVTTNVTVNSSPCNATSNATLQQNWQKDLKALKTCATGSAGSAGAGVGLVAAGSNVISTAGKFAGSTPGTSIASQFFRTILPQSIDATLAPTLMNPLATSSTLGGVVGRWVPIAGEGLLVYSGVKFLNCISDNGDGFW